MTAVIFPFYFIVTLHVFGSVAELNAMRSGPAISNAISVAALRFGHLFDDPVLVDLEEHGGNIRNIEFSANHVILKPKGAASTIWIINSGKALVIHPQPFGSEQISRPAFPHEIFGLTEALAGLPYIGMVTSVSDCSFKRLDYRFLIDAFSLYPQFRKKLLCALAESYIEGINKLTAPPDM